MQGFCLTAGDYPPTNGFTKRNYILEDPMELDVSKMKNPRIRRLTPTECARLQTIPEWYKFRRLNPKTGADEPTSDTQIYRMLGNGWTVEVIKHIFSYLPESLTGVKPTNGTPGPRGIIGA